jgi:hypothetical protein
MRFNNPDEVKQAAEKFAAEIVRNHFEKNHGLNPYCTPGARDEFDRGYANAPRRSWDIDPAWDFRYQTGQAVARIIKARGAKNDA